MEGQDERGPPSSADLLRALGVAGLPTLGGLATALWSPVFESDLSQGVLVSMLLETAWRAVVGGGPLAAAVVLSARWLGRPVPSLLAVWRRLWFPAMGAMLAVLAGLQMCIVPGLGVALLAVLFLDPVALAEGRQPVVRTPTGIPTGSLAVWLAWSIWMGAVAPALWMWAVETGTMAVVLVGILSDLMHVGLLTGWCLRLR